MVSGGRQGEAGPLALKREFRQHEAEAARLDRVAQEQQIELTDSHRNGHRGEEKSKCRSERKHVEAEKSFVGATHRAIRPARNCGAWSMQLGTEQQEIACLRQEAEAASNRVNRRAANTPRRSFPRCC